MKFNYFLDMDGCLTNYTEHFQDVFGIHHYEYKETHTWDEYLDLVESGGTDFWAQMKWMPDGQEWWNYISKQGDIKILSYPLERPSCIPGKLEWCVTNLGLSESDCIFNQDKAKFCQNWNDLLIDDTGDNLLNWRAAGGMAIQHTTAKCTIDIVEALNDIPDKEYREYKFPSSTTSNLPLYDKTEEMEEESEPVKRESRKSVNATAGLSLTDVIGSKLFA